MAKATKGLRQINLISKELDLGAHFRRPKEYREDSVDRGTLARGILGRHSVPIEAKVNDGFEAENHEGTSSVTKWPERRQRKMWRSELCLPFAMGGGSDAGM